MVTCAGGYKISASNKSYFSARGVQAECIANGAMELAPSMGLCRRIVDLGNGSTLAANGLVELETISEVSSRLR